MNRRGFLSLLAPAAALIVAPELLIPKRTFFLPPAGGWRPGDAMTATEVMARVTEAMARLAAYPPMIVLNQTAYHEFLKLGGEVKPGGIHYIENRPIAVFGGTPPYTWSQSRPYG